MVSMHASNAVDRGSGKTKDYQIDICCISSKHAALMRLSKDRLTRDNVSEWSDKSTCRLLFQWASTTKIQLIVLV